MRIAQIVCTFPPYKGGMGNCADKFSRLLSGYGHDIKVITPDYNPCQEAEAKADPVGLHVRRLKPWLKFGNSAILPQIFRELQGCDMAYLHYPFFGTSIIVLLWKIFHRNKKLILHYHMDAVSSNYAVRILMRILFWIDKWLFDLADGISCASLDYVKSSSMKKVYQVHARKFYEIPFGVDKDRFVPAEKNLNRTKTLLFVGGLDRAHYFKGVDVLIEAVSRLRYPDWKLNIIGSGDMEQAYRIKSQNLSVGSRICFLGNVGNADLPARYQEADVLVLPSINQGEAFGLVLLEAMACGVPVIASDLPGVRSVFRDHLDGLLIAPNDPDDLAEKADVLLMDDKIRLSMGRSARGLVENKYDWEKVGRGLDSLVNKIGNGSV